MIAFALSLLLSAAPPSGSDPYEVYLDAYVIREDDPDRAKELFQWVVDHTPPDDTQHEKAVAWLKALKNKHTKKKKR
ncbi:MAG: hypothetical protein ACO1OB_20355 [Archangium sp.]